MPGSRVREVTSCQGSSSFGFWPAGAGALVKHQEKNVFPVVLQKYVKDFVFLLLNIGLDLQPTEQPLPPFLSLPVNFLGKGQLCHLLLTPSDSWFCMRSSLGPPRRTCWCHTFTWSFYKLRPCGQAWTPPSTLFRAPTRLAVPSPDTVSLWLELYYSRGSIRKPTPLTHALYFVA